MFALNQSWGFPRVWFLDLCHLIYAFPFGYFNRLNLINNSNPIIHVSIVANMECLTNKLVTMNAKKQSLTA